jgi:membrane protein
MGPVKEPRKEWMIDRILAPVTFGAGPVGRVVRFFVRDVWRVETERLPLVQRAFFRVCRIGFLTWRGITGDRVFSRASALTYITALSIIPMLALAFSALKGLGIYSNLVQERIEPFLDKNLGVPGTEGVSALREPIDQILLRIDAMEFRSLGLIGLLIVVWATMRLLGSVEGAFNEIWGVKKSRSIVRRLSDYLTIVIVTPILLALTTLGQVKQVMATVDRYVGPIIDALMTLAPVLGGWLALTFIYLALPNTRTRFLSSLIGGFVAGVLWVLALQVHVWMQLGVASYSAFYAGFAAIPVFLVWVQISWVIVLLGAEIAFAHEHEPAYRGLASHNVLGQSSRETLALRALVRITHAFLSADSRRTTASIAAELGVSPRSVEEVLRTLEGAQLVVCTEDVEESGDVFVLSRDPGRITIKMVQDALRAVDTGESIAPRGMADEEVDRLLAKMGDEAAGSAYNLNLRELVERAERRGANAGAAVATDPGVQLS